MHNLADTYTSLVRHADALKLRQETFALRKAKLGPDHPDTLLTMLGVAESLVALDRVQEAMPVLDECERLAKGKAVDPDFLLRATAVRLRKFEKAKDAAGCRQLGEAWEKLNRTDSDGLYLAACLRSVTAAVLRAADKSPGANRPADDEADRAMVWLKQAVAAGFRDAAHLKKDHDVDSLRAREDFKKLLAELERVPSKSP